MAEQLRGHRSNELPEDVSSLRGYEDLFAKLQQIRADNLRLADEGFIPENEIGHPVLGIERATEATNSMLAFYKERDGKLPTTYQGTRQEQFCNVLEGTIQGLPDLRELVFLLNPRLRNIQWDTAVIKFDNSSHHHDGHTSQIQDELPTYLVIDTKPETETVPSSITDRSDFAYYAILLTGADSSSRSQAPQQVVDTFIDKNYHARNGSVVIPEHSYDPNDSTKQHPDDGIFWQGYFTRAEDNQYTFHLIPEDQSRFHKKRKTRKQLFYNPHTVGTPKLGASTYTTEQMSRAVKDLQLSQNTVPGIVSLFELQNPIMTVYVKT